MNKSDLIQKFQEEAELSKKTATGAVELLFGQMAETLAAGDRVEIRGFCSFHVKDYDGYTGRNPKTGERTEVPPKKLPFIKPGKELKDRVDG